MQCVGIRELEWRALSLYPGGKGQGGKEARRADTRREREEAMHERMRALRDPGTGGRVSDRRGNPEKRPETLKPLNINT